MANILYKNYKGRSVTTHSYSGGSTFRYCRQKYFLERIKGWRDKEDRASFHFGNCIEAAIMYHVSNKCVGGVEDFWRRWDKVKELVNLKYTEKEGSWEDLLRMGKSLMQLFQVWWTKIAITDPKWQLQYKKEVFPGAENYAGLEYTSFIDLRGIYKEKPLIVDIKTSGVSLPDNQSMLQLDSQLADYAWVTGIPDVAFLVLVKAGAEFQKGDSATILATGLTMRVANANSEDNTVLLLTDPDYAKYEKDVAGVKGNALKEIKKNYDSIGIRFTSKELTKCRLQFLTTTIPPDMIQEAGEIEGQNLVDIKASYDSNHWPRDGKGIRFPNNKCLSCSMRGICTKDDKLRDELLINLSVTPALPPPIVGKDLPGQDPEEDWLDKLMG